MCPSVRIHFGRRGPLARSREAAANCRMISVAFCELSRQLLRRRVTLGRIPPSRHPTMRDLLPTRLFIASFLMGTLNNLTLS